jgi:glutamate dehydrogenase (NADP+)
VPCDVALPCATQNELNGEDAALLVKNGCIACRKAPTCRPTSKACTSSRKAQILFAPGKAANAGGVAVSGLEMSQNSARMSWKEAELQQLLKDIMDGIHERCVEYGRVSGTNLHRLCEAAPTSPASRRSPTRCWRTASSE